MNICVFGASSSRLEPRFFDAAAEMGTLLAKKGHTVVFGGGQDGLMGACAIAAKKSGGNILGIAPRFFDEPGFLLHSCDEFLFTDTMAERKELMVEKSEAFLVLPGGIGTMDEFFEVITLKQLGKAFGPIVLLNTAGFYDPLYAFLAGMASGGFMSERCLDLIRLCSDPMEALAALEQEDPLKGDIFRLEDYTK